MILWWKQKFFQSFRHNANKKKKKIVFQKYLCPKSTNNMAALDHLPEEILYNIASRLESNDLAKFSRCSKILYSVCSSDEVCCLFWIYDSILECCHKIEKKISICKKIFHKAHLCEFKIYDLIWNWMRCFMEFNL